MLVNKDMSVLDPPHLPEIDLIIKKNCGQNNRGPKSRFLKNFAGLASEQELKELHLYFGILAIG